MTTAADILARGKQLHLAGDLAGAAELYQQIVLLDPAHAEALGQLGLAFHQQGNLAEAQGSYERALAIRPDDPEVQFRMGVALAGLGRADEAALHFREVIRLRPDSAEAWNNLGNVLLLKGKAADAIPCYHEAVRLRPSYAEAQLNLGHALRENDKLEEGLACYREAVRLRPDYFKAHNNLAVALLEMGEMAQAETHFRESLRCNPGSAQVLYALAANGLYTEADPGLDELAARLADPRVQPQEASRLHAILGNLLDRARRYDDAFHHSREANLIRRELARQAGDAFDPDEHARFVDRLIAVFTPQYFEHVQGLGLETEVPVFVVGMPRSGSSLVEQILSHHPEIAAVGELRDLPHLADSLSERLVDAEQYPECVTHLDAASVQRLGNEYVNRLQELAGPARRIIDKMLSNFLHLGLIASLFPRARVIHCRRDPLDVCVSCFLNQFRALDFTWDLEDLGRYYCDYERLMAHWRTVLPLPMLDVVYEELLRDPEGIIKGLVAFCGLPWDECCLRFYENPRPVRTVSKQQVRQPLYHSSVGRWRLYAAHLAPLQVALGLAAEKQPD